VGCLLYLQEAVEVEGLGRIPYNWLRVLETAEGSQVDHRIRHQLHPIVSLLDTFKTEQQPLELVLPRKGPLDLYASRVDGCIAEAFASALDVLASTQILFDVRAHAGVEKALAIACGITATIAVHISASQV
jgi:hypothetical protein